MRGTVQFIRRKGLLQDHPLHCGMKLDAQSHRRRKNYSVTGDCTGTDLTKYQAPKCAPDGPQIERNG